MRHRLIQDQGNFGSIAGLPPAAMRYTEAKPVAHCRRDARRSRNATPSTSSTTTTASTSEPLVLPSKFPNLLVNGC